MTNTTEQQKAQEQEQKKERIVARLHGRVETATRYAERLVEAFTKEQPGSRLASFAYKTEALMRQYAIVDVVTGLIQQTRTPSWTPTTMRTGIMNQLVGCAAQVERSTDASTNLSERVRLAVLAEMLDEFV